MVKYSLFYMQTEVDDSLNKKCSHFELTIIMGGRGILNHANSRKCKNHTLF